MMLSRGVSVQPTHRHCVVSKFSYDLDDTQVSCVANLNTYRKCYRRNE